jgi:AcrR family transcriptional regulator
MSKGFKTKEIILKAGLEITSKFGLESLSIGELAKSVGMSKSGLFSHFKSKETLQIMVLDYASESFTEKVVKPAITKERGLPRLKEMMKLWKSWSENDLAGGCPFISAIVEYDDRPGKIHEHLKTIQAQMISTFERSIKISIEEKHLGSKTDAKQFAYSLYSNMIGFHVYNRLLKDKNSKDYFQVNLERLIEFSKTQN